MGHQVRSVGELYNDAKALYNNVVIGPADSSADSIINKLKAGVNVLKESWKGKDAGIQINDIVTVINAMVAIRNRLAELAESACDVARNYREVQISNGAQQLEALGKLSWTRIGTESAYSDNTDTINITNDALKGKSNVQSAKNNMEIFVNQVNTYRGKIEGNWTQGPGVEDAKAAFDKFVNDFKNTYKPALETVVSHIDTALRNYGITA